MNTEVKIKIGDKQMPVELHVEVKAKRLGRKWSKQEEKKLISMYKHGWPYALMVSELQRTETALKSRLQILGVVEWDKETQDYIEKKPHKSKESKVTIAKSTNTPQNRVGKHWTSAEEKRLERLHLEGKSIIEMMALMGRTESAIMARLVKMGYFIYNKETKQYEIQSR